MDYKKLGLKAGIECHQQLNTKKLFCNCDSELIEKEPDFTIERKLRPVASETGTFDKAALQEFNKGKYYIYEAYNKEICLVELDEEPPHEINKDALNVVLEVALKTNANVFDKAFVMRKMVIDGSNTSGFQRTVLIAVDGKLKIKNKEVGIGSICLEEDAAKNIESKKEYTKYRLDRLGIPLIEFTTKPDLETPEEVKECAAKIGELFRITGKAKRGLGSIRQDVNVSIKEGARVEIKGVQYLDLIDKYVENEVLRQLNLLKVKEMLNKKTKKEIQEFKIYDVSKELEKSQNKRVLDALKKGQKALAIKLKDFKGIIGYEIQPERRVGTELASYAKAKTKVKGLFHSDELPKYNINEDVVKAVKEKLEMQKEDAFIIIVEREEVAKNALKVVFDRALKLFEGIPEETRNPLENATTEYSRPLPGAARMYPETDVPVLEITKEKIKEIKKDLPLWYEERIKNYMQKGINKQIAEQIAKSNYARFFSKNMEKYDVKKLADFVLNLTVKPEKAIWLLESEINRKHYKEAFKLIKEGKTKEQILDKLKEESLDEIAKNIVLEVLEKNKEFIKKRGLTALNPMMGSCLKEIMKKTNKKPNMKQLSEFISEEINKILR